MITSILVPGPSRSPDRREPPPAGGASSALGATCTRAPLVRNQVLYPLSYEGNRASATEALAGREGFEPSVEDLNPRQALSRRPRSASSGTSPSGKPGGGRGIRTPGGLPHSCSQDSRLRPLGHPSGRQSLPEMQSYHGDVAASRRCTGHRVNAATADTGR